MIKAPSEIEPYIDRSYYDTVLIELRGQHTTAYYIGKRNPYSGKRITTEEEADIYLQQQAMSIMYRQAADAAILKNRSETVGHIETLEYRISDLERRLRRRRFLSFILCIALVIGGVFYLPQKLRTSYDAGYAQGYEGGKTVAQTVVVPSGSDSSPSRSFEDYNAAARAGAAAGAADAAKRSSGNKTISDLYEEQVGSRSGSYITSPRSGYSLDMTVYVSKNGGKIHRSSSCSGMKYYNTMTYGEACERGYSHCQKCF